MFELRGLSIRSKVFLSFATILVLFCSFSLWHLSQALTRAKLHTEESKSVALARLAAYTAAPALIFDDNDAIEDIIGSVSQIEDVVYVLVQDADGNTVGEHGLALVNSVGSLTRDGVTSDGSYVSASAPVNHNGRQIGTVRVGVSLKEALRAVRRSQVQGLLVGGLALLGVFAAAYLLSGLLTRSLTQMVSAAGRISDGDLSQRVRVESKDELGQLASAFNGMVDRLEVTHQDLQEANRTLETRVEVRTRKLNAEIDERTRAEQALILSEQRFRTMVESAPIGIALFDAHGALIEANARIENLLGLKRAEIANTPIRELVVPDDWEELRSQLAALNEGTVNGFQIDVRCRNAAGLTRWTRSSLSAVRDDSRALKFIIAMIDDQTDQKELEERYRQSQKLEAVGRLAGGIAHDFNNLLMTINGLSDLVLEDLPPSDPVKLDIEQIRAAGERAALLTRQLLAFSRRQVLQPAALDVNQIVADLSRLLSRVIGENIELVTEPGQGTVHIHADRGQIDQVLMNLIVNARDAMPNGGRLSIETAAVFLDRSQARRYDLESSGRYVIISVSDTGCGIDHAIQEQIFEPFFTTKPVGKGTGLGLATVYGIVQQSGGGILVESEIGEGAVFRVALPEHVGVPSEIKADIEPTRVGHETVLLVEDEHRVREVVARVLRRAGYEVLEARHGADALLLAKRHKGPIHLLLTDVVMPELNGPELAHELDKVRPGIPCIFMSGYTRDAALPESATQEIAFIQKPMSPGTLARTVRAVLDGLPANSERVAEIDFHALDQPLHHAAPDGQVGSELVPARNPFRIGGGAPAASGRP